MIAFVYAVPYIPPPPPAPLWEGYRMRWTGCDGSEWILDGSQGVALLQDGLVGLHFPEFDVYESTSPAVAGARLRGSRARKRAVEWNLLVWNDESSEEWRKLHRAFFRAFSVDKPGTWTVRDPSGRALTLKCYLVPGSHAYDRDPSQAGWSLYQMQMVAYQPFWSGEPIPYSWRAATPEPFFDEAGSPDFHISDSANVSTATMTNPGDVPAWPIWTVTAPMTSLSITVAGGTLTIPALTGTQKLVIDTDPNVATALRDGVDVSGLIDPWDPRPIPPGEDVPVTITADGFGTVAAEITPRYYLGT